MDPSGSKKYWLGGDTLGHIFYTREGYMSAHLSRKERTETAQKILFQDTAEEKAALFVEGTSYTGTFDIDSSQKTVTHHVHIASDPCNVGAHLTRDYHFDTLSDGTKTLCLSTTYRDGSKLVLDWKKMQSYKHGTVPVQPRTLG